MSVCTGQDKELLGELFLQLICEPGFPEEKAHLSSFIPTTNSTLRCFGEEWLRGSDKKQLEVSSLLVFSSSPPQKDSVTWWARASLQKSLVWLFGARQP